MQKIYLKYDEYTPPVECDYGFIPEMVYLGFLYPIKIFDNKYIFKYYISKIPIKCE